MPNRVFHVLSSGKIVKHDSNKAYKDPIGIPAEEKMMYLVIPKSTREEFDDMIKVMNRCGRQSSSQNSMSIRDHTEPRIASQSNSEKRPMSYNFNYKTWL